MRNAEGCEHGADAARIRCGGALERDVGAIQAGARDALGAHVPAVALVLVLALRAQVGDLLLDPERAGAVLPPDPVMQRGARCRSGPHQARYDFQQLCLAGAVRAGHDPTLCRPDRPVDVTQNRAASALQVQMREAHLELVSIGAAHARHWIMQLWIGYSGRRKTWTQ